MIKEEALFVLREGLAFTTATALAESTKQRIGSDDADVVISCAGARQGSKLISNDFAALLKEFQTPQTLAGAIFNYAQKTDRDAQQVADEVFSMLASIQEAGFLVHHGEGRSPTPNGLKEGDSFRGYKVLKKVQEFDDTDVYKLTDAAGNAYALKRLITNGQSHVVDLFHNEVAVLQRLDGRVNPTLIEQGIEGGVPFLITAWCDGVPCTAAAASYQNTNSRTNVLKLLDICIRIAHALQHVHSQGVLHGDLQPANILVSKRGQVTILDYGYAAYAGNEKSIQRGGTGFYYEPEYALHFLEGKSRPALTEKGEQYSLAVLLYQLLSGHEYLHFKFEKEKLYQQIAHEAPLSFKDLDLRFPPALDEALQKALSKNKEARFSSVEAFAEALFNARKDVADSHHFFSVGNENSDEHFTNYLIGKFGWQSTFIEQGLRKPPTGSVNYGAAGIAYMYYRISLLRGDADLMSLADTWAARASHYSEFDTDFYSLPLGITKQTVGSTSLYHSPAGVHLVQALISSAKGDYGVLTKSIQAFVAVANAEDTLPDLALGRCGLLLGCSLLYQEVQSIHDGYTAVIKKCAAALLQKIWEAADAEPPLHTPNSIGYFGIAHGWAGWLYATLHWCSNADVPLPEGFYRRVDELMGCCSTQNKLHWPLSLSNRQWWPGWCHGSAGHIFLQVRLYDFLADERYLQHAAELAAGIMHEKQQANNLCCGNAGIAYALLALYKTTGDKIYLDAVKKLKHGIMKNIASPLDTNNSLYKGEVGLGVLLSESLVPERARMPLFE